MQTMLRYRMYLLGSRPLWTLSTLRNSGAHFTNRFRAGNSSHNTDPSCTTTRHLERQDLSHTYLAHHDLESNFIMIIVYYLRQPAVCAGESVYLPERERIMGQKSKVTARLADRAARRSHALALAYATSMAASVLMILADSLARSKLA